jgi:hypothetical protein
VERANISISTVSIKLEVTVIALALRADRIEMKQSFWVLSFIYSIDIYLTSFSEGGFVSTAFIMHLSL